MWQALRALILLVGVSSIAVAESYKTNRLADDGIHDPENDAINILQEPGEAMVDFPLDKRGKIEWVQAISDGLGLNFIHTHRERFLDFVTLDILNPNSVRR